MKKFCAPLMEIQRLVPADVFTNSACRVEVLGCWSCYCSAVGCDDTYVPCPKDGCGCNNDLGF